jgi:hypothetical protein
MRLAPYFLKSFFEMSLVSFRGSASGSGLTAHGPPALNKTILDIFSIH